MCAVWLIHQESLNFTKISVTTKPKTKQTVSDYCCNHCVTDSSFNTQNPTQEVHFSPPSHPPHPPGIQSESSSGYWRWDASFVSCRRLPEINCIFITSPSIRRSDGRTDSRETPRLTTRTRTAQRECRLGFNSIMILVRTVADTIHSPTLEGQVPSFSSFVRCPHEPWNQSSCSFWPIKYHLLMSL